jgi:hypothetical protein
MKNRNSFPGPQLFAKNYMPQDGELIPLEAD